jgi:LysR family glycine cleavage system transcriptional activator
MTIVLPLLGLRAFVEVGRYGSIKAAAHRMGVTSGAVSQQIKLLEARIGITLLTRERYGVRLTKAGANAHPTLLRAFEQIEVGLEMLQTVGSKCALIISTTPSFAATWLVPRIGRFTECHPDIEVRIEASSSLVDLRRDRVDITIRHGLGDYPGLAVLPLYAPALLPVASPALLAKGPPILQPIDCLAYPLLHDAVRADWPLWLQAFGVENDARATQGTSLEDDYLVIRSAEEGHGMALVRDVHARDAIATGRLVLALDKPWPSRFAYYLVILPNSVRRREVIEFIDWIIQQVK